MIAIVNVSPEVRPFGVHTYELRINQKVIATFEHRREDNLATCLRKAAQAYEKALSDELAVVMDIMRREEVFICPVCSSRSMNPNDIKHRYCGNCHRFMEDV